MPLKKRHNGSLETEPTKSKVIKSDQSLKQEMHDPDQWQPGAIVRISVQNFVTYDEVTCYPGPHLNLVVGPNGSGKSTIVCAIALGLGGSPSLLGRQTEISEFVKTGKDEGFIEIELKGSGVGNIVIKRTLVATDNRSNWYLNGKQSTKRQVLDTVAKLHVQVDNLCQFLPQDKVSYFAELTPEELLDATQRAAGRTGMAEQHTILIDLKREERALAARFSREKEELGQEIGKNSRLEADMARYQEHQRIRGRIKVLEVLELWLQYKSQVAQVAALKQRRAQMAQKIKDLDNRVQPYAARKKKLDDETQALRHAARDFEREESRLSSLLDDEKEKADRFGSEAESSQSQLEGFNEKVQQDEIKLRELESKVAEGLKTIDERRVELLQLGFLRDEGLVAFSSTELFQIEELLKQCTAETECTEEKLADAELALRTFNNEHMKPVKDRIAMLKRELEELQDRQKLKKHAIARIFGNESQVLFKAMQAIDEMRSQLDHAAHVVAFALEISDSRFCQFVESTLNHNQLLTIVVQTRNDYFRVKRELIDRRKLRVNISMPQLNADIRPPVSVDGIKRLGFDGYLIDFVQGPEAVLQFLKQHARLHEIPVSVSDRLPISFDQLLRESQQLRFRTVFIGGKCLRIRSAYGAQSVREDHVRESQIFEHSLSRHELARINGEIAQNTSQLESKEATRQKYADALRQRQVELEELREKMRRYRNQGVSIQKKGQQYNSLVQYVDNAKNDLELAKLQRTARTSEKARMVVQMRRCRLQQVEQLCSGVLTGQTRLCELEDKRIKIKLNLVEALAMQSKEASAFSEARGNLTRLEAEYESATKESKEQKESVHRLKDKLQGLLTERTDEERTELQERGDSDLTNIEEIRSELEVLRSKLSLVVVDRPKVFEEFQERQKRIGELQSAVAEMEASLRAMQERLGEIESEWRSEVKNLIEPLDQEFRRSFEALGCAGEVRLREDPNDYSKFGIDILVKFRDSEDLMRLTGHQQSGGERSVSTIMYLMAMQQLTKVPFRVVDEINQGMDPRNERQVHNQLVRIACRPQKTQYFLITPKLLTHLDYHPRMRILCIFKGSHLQPFQL